MDLAGLFRSHAAGLAGCVRSVLGPTEDPRDLLQESFAKAWRALSDGARPSDPVAWTFVLVLNSARDEARRRGRRPPRTDWDEVQTMAIDQRSRRPDERLAGRETGTRLRHALAALAPNEKEVVVLRLGGDRTFETIAETLGIPVGTAKTRMRAGLAKLRRALADLDPASDLTSGGAAAPGDLR